MTTSKFNSQDNLTVQLENWAAFTEISLVCSIFGTGCDRCQMEFVLVYPRGAAAIASNSRNCTDQLLSIPIEFSNPKEAAKFQKTKAFKALHKAAIAMAEYKI